MNERTLGNIEAKLDIVIEQTKEIPTLKEEIAVHNERIKRLEKFVTWGGTVLASITVAFLIYYFKIG